MKLRRSGGDAVKICDVPAFFPGAAWGPDGTILFPKGWLQGLSRVSADGGEPTLLTTVNTDVGEKGHWWPKFLPDGRHALFTIWNEGAGLIDSEIALLDVETGEHRKLLRGAIAEFLPPGHIVYYHAGSYHAVAFDPDTLEIAGDPVPVLEDATDPLPHGTRDIRLAISGRGTLFYNARQIHPPVRLAIVEPGAAPQLLAFPTRSTVNIAPSPNGRTIAAPSLESGVWFIRLLDLQNGTDERVDLVGSSRAPFWKPDGSGFAFDSMRKGDFDLYFKDVRTGGPEQPIRITPTDETPRGWSADGTEIFIRESQPDGGMLIKAVPADGTSDDSFVLGEFQTDGLIASPDGRWLAYNSPRAGENRIYVRPYPGPGAEVRVSPEVGRQPAWSPDGTELYYARGQSIVAVSYTVQQGRFQPGNEEVLFESPLLAQNATRPLGVLGHRRFVVGLLEEEPGRPSLNVVLNWSREVADRLAAESE